MTENGWNKSTSLYQACRHAVAGIVFAYRQEANIRRQTALALIAFILAGMLRVPAGGVLALVLVSALVLTAELINSAIEHLADTVHPQFSLSLRHTKDIMAGAVLLTSGSAVITALFVFVPAVYSLLSA